MTDDKGRRNRHTAHVGAMIATLWLVGLVGLFCGVAALMDREFLGGGVCILASAVAIGQMLNAYARK